MQIDCLFCRMSNGAIPVDKLHEDAIIFAIRDIQPRAPSHILVIPRRHITSAANLTNDDAPLVGHMLLTANRIARELEFADSGYRLTFNVGADGGQTIYHLHLHLMGGARLGPEP